MYKRLNIILISLVIIILSIFIFLTVFVFIKPKNTIPLSVTAENISLKVGNSLKNFYTVSEDNAEVSFEVENSNIIDINANEITGKQTGKTNVVITASKDDKIAKTSFEVSVINSDITFTIETISNCNYVDNKLVMSSTACQFSIKFYSKEQTLISNNNLHIEIPDNVNLINDISSFILVTEQNCQVKFILEDYDFCYILNIEIENN